MSPLYLYNGKLLKVANALAINENCCCAECCLIGDGKGSIFLCGTNGDTCWGVTGNAHLFFSECSSDTITIKGLGIIGEIDQATIEANVKYDNNLISISPNINDCPINEAVIRTSTIDCITIIAEGSRNTGTAQGWEHSPSLDPAPGQEGCGGKTPGLVGGQGAYTITISDVDPNGAFEVHIRLQCEIYNTTAFPQHFAVSPGLKEGTYFYVAGDNQNLGSSLNGVIRLVCGPEGRMIESAVLPNFGNMAAWNTTGDCIVWLVEGWIVPV